VAEPHGHDGASLAALAGGILTTVSAELWLVRHGAVDRAWTAADPPLSAEGHAEAKTMAAALAGASRLADITAIHCSPMRRTQQTAAPLAAAFDLPVVLHDGLAEFDRYSPEYLLMSELKARGDIRYEQMMAGDLSAWGTDWTTFRNGALAALRDVVAAVDRIGVVVTHGGIINALVGVALGHDRAWLNIPANCSLTRIGVSANGSMKLLSLNETWYLRDLPEQVGH
jgi:broad specificity phosphatase PhoE